MSNGNPHIGLIVKTDIPCSISSCYKYTVFCISLTSSLYLAATAIRLISTLPEQMVGPKDCWKFARLQNGQPPYFVIKSSTRYMLLLFLVVLVEGYWFVTGKFHVYFIFLRAVVGTCLQLIMLTSLSPFNKLGFILLLPCSPYIIFLSFWRWSFKVLTTKTFFQKKDRFL